MNDAARCRKNGWVAGTRLVGTDADGPTVIEITAVGRETVLAVAISEDGKPCKDEHEYSWMLDQRKWRKVKS